MSTTTMPGAYTRAELGPEAFQFYADQGYLILLDALNGDEVEALRQETVQICRGERGQVTIPERQAVKTEDLATMPESELLRQFLCIHHPHKISGVMHNALAHPAMVDVLTGVIGPDVKCMQSMLFIKSSGKPGQAWHQDEDFIPTRDRSLAGGWIALDDATIENGCLWVIPGSHKPGVLWPMYQHNDDRFDCAAQSYGFPYSEEDEIPVEVPAGAIVFFNGYLLHRSLPNRAPAGTYRRVLVNHYMSASSLLPWDKNHERVESAPVAESGRPDRANGLPRHRHGGRSGPLCLQGNRRTGHGACAFRRRRWLRRWPGRP